MKIEILSGIADLNTSLEGANVKVGASTCGTLPSTITESTWYTLDCMFGQGLKGKFVKIEGTKNTLSFCGIKVYGYEYEIKWDSLPGQGIALSLSYKAVPYVVNRHGVISM